MGDAKQWHTDRREVDWRDTGETPVCNVALAFEPRARERRDAGIGGLREKGRRNWSERVREYYLGNSSMSGDLNTIVSSHCVG